MSNEVISPRKGLIGDNFSASTDWKESRQALRATLEGKISYNHDRVFARLGVNHIDDALASEFARALIQNLTVEVEALKVLANQASAPSRKFAKNIGSSAIDTSGQVKNPKAQELKMYPHLVSD